MLYCFIYFLILSVTLFADITSPSGTMKFDSNNDSNAELVLNSTGLGIGVSPGANLHVNGNVVLTDLNVTKSISIFYQNLSSNTVLGENSLVLVDTSASDITLTLPYAGNAINKQYSIKKKSNNYCLTIDTQGELIDNETSVSLGAAYRGFPYINLFSDGQQWYIERQSVDYTLTAASNLVGWWKLDEANGNAIKDSSGYSHDGSINNIDSSDIGQVGKFGRAIDFETDDDHVIISESDDLELQVFSYSFWIKFNDTGTQNIIMTYKTNLLTNLGAILVRRETANTITAFIYDGTNYEPRVTSPSTVTNDTWYHVLISFDGTNFNLYLDGVLATVDRTSDGEFTDVKYATTNNLYLGNNGTAGDGAKAVLDDIRLYNKALDLSDVLSLFRQGN